MIRTQTDSGVIACRYDDDIKMIEMNTDGSLTLMRAHQVLNLIEVLKTLVEYHDSHGMDQSGMKRYIRFCREDGREFSGPDSIMETREIWSGFRVHQEACKRAFTLRHKHIYSHYKINGTGTTFATGVKNDDAT